VAQALSQGFKPAAVWITGLVTGDMVYLLMAMFGMGWVAEQLGDGFIFLKWLGAGYLVFLGVRCWIFSMRSNQGGGDARHATGKGKSYLSGLCVTLGNPKVIAFYCGFLPGFIDMQSFTLWDATMVVGIVIPVLLAVLFTYAWLGSLGGSALKSTKLWKITNRTAGSVMIGAGLAVAAE
jgi:threonine/homoserine/homoserine lactone efflux protein